jgi:phosphoenolpyruvate-protein kinase (PTS system EI component)
MIEIPSAAFCASSILAAGATNLLVGLNDLSCLMLGRDRGGMEMKLHDAVWQAVGLIAGAANGHEWGIAGSLSRAVVERATAQGVPYVSVHYADLPSVVGIPEDNLADLEHVRRVKNKTRTAIQNRANVVSSQLSGAKQ